MEKQVRRLAAELAATRAEVAGYRRQWTAVTRPDTAELQARVSLHEMLVGHFNNEELMQLCFALGVFWDRLAGDTLDALPNWEALLESRGFDRVAGSIADLGSYYRLREKTLLVVDTEDRAALEARLAEGLGEVACLYNEITPCFVPELQAALAGK